MDKPEFAAVHDGYVRFATADPRPINIRLLTPYNWHHSSGDRH
jgi:hypothetical protein